MSRLVAKLRAYGKVLPKGKRNRTDLVRYLVRRPALLVAIGGYEAAVFTSGSVDSRTKALASVKTSSLIGCPF